MFFKKQKISKKEVIDFDFDTLDFLDDEMKMIIADGQELVSKVRYRMYELGNEIDLTSKMQLREDCTNIEKNLVAIYAGDDSKNMKEKLTFDVTCLKTAAEHIIGAI